MSCIGDIDTDSTLTTYHIAINESCTNKLKYHSTNGALNYTKNPKPTKRRKLDKPTDPRLKTFIIDTDYDLNKVKLYDDYPKPRDPRIKTKNNKQTSSIHRKNPSWMILNHCRISSRYAHSKPSISSSSSSDVSDVEPHHHSKCTILDILSEKPVIQKREKDGRRSGKNVHYNYYNVKPKKK
eukprot:513666_1